MTLASKFGKKTLFCASSVSGTVQVIVVEVVDTGHGVPAEARKSLFSKFVQGSEKQMEKARTVSGTGLGLSICAKQARPSHFVRAAQQYQHPHP